MDLAIDRLVQFAGWTDKIAAVFGGANPVAGPYFSFSTPEPTGVVAAIAPQDDPLLGLVSVIAPIITSGNTCVVIANRSQPLPAITLAEVLATSDLPGGVVNILTGDPAEIAPHLAAHGDVNALDVTGASVRCAPNWNGRPRAPSSGCMHPPGCPTSPVSRGPRGCGRSWRPRRSGTRPARCRWRVGPATDLGFALPQSVGGGASGITGGSKSKSTIVP